MLPYLLSEEKVFVNVEADFPTDVQVITPSFDFNKLRIVQVDRIFFFLIDNLINILKNTNTVIVETQIQASAFDIEALCCVLIELITEKTLLVMSLMSDFIQYLEFDLLQSIRVNI